MPHSQLIECVPNFSVGRDQAGLDAIGAAIASVNGVMVLRSEMDPDHNRAVITFAGPPEAVLEGAFRGIRSARDRIDLRAHSGVHPRMGAADVVPLVPLEGATLSECVGLAHRLGARVWNELEIPVYFYEAAALEPSRVRLESVRRGGFENPGRVPDIGGPRLHPSAGACLIGARKFLIAFNVNLDTSDVSIAREIARRIRASSGGMPNVKALGLLLASRNIAQVSMNLTDFESTPLYAVYERVRAEAAALGAGVAGTEIVGLVPEKALDLAPADLAHSSQVLENRLHWFRRRADMKRNATAVWQGGIKDGHGSITTASGALSNTPYSFNARFENGTGTNPEELIAAAHAGCFAMALSGQLGAAGMTAEQIHATAAVTLEKVEGGFAITASHLEVKVKIPGADREAFEKAAQAAKSGCPVSKLLNANVTMNAVLEN